jgi:hypothetical protein
MGDHAASAIVSSEHGQQGLEKKLFIGFLAAA